VYVEDSAERHFHRGEKLYGAGQYAAAAEQHQVALDLRRASKEGPSALACSYEAVGKCLYLLQDFGGARECHAEALSIREGLHGRNHIEVAGSLANLGQALQSLGEYDTAFFHIDRAFQITRKKFGDSHLRTVAAKEVLGAFYLDTGNGQKSHELLTSCLSVRKTLLGEGTSHADIAQSSDLLARSFRQSFKHRDAVELHKAALSMCQEIFGESHPRVAHALSQLATSLRSYGSVALARELQEKSVEMQRDLGAQAGGCLAVGLDNLGHCLAADARLSQAEEAYRESLCLKIDRAASLDSVAESYENLANIYKRQGKYDVALKEVERCIRLLGSESSQQHITLARMLDVKGTVHALKGEFRESEAALQRSLVLKSTEVADSLPVAATLELLASLAQSRGEFQKALGLYDRAMSVYGSLLGASHPRTALCIQRKAKVHLKQGDPSMAESELHKSLSILRRIVDREHPMIADVCEDLAGLHSQDVPASVQWLEKAYQMRKSRLGAEHPETVSAMMHIGASSLALNSPVVAVEFFEKSVDALTQRLGEDSIEVARARRGLARAYVYQGMYDRAQPLYERAIIAGHTQCGRTEEVRSWEQELDSILTGPSSSPVLDGGSALTQRLREKEHGELRRLTDLLYDAREKYGETHLDTAQCYHSLGIEYAATDTHNAVRMLQKAVAVRTSLLGEEHEATLESMSSLGEAYRSEGQTQEALNLHRKAFETRLQLLGDASTLTGHSARQIGLDLASLGHYEDALTWYNKSVRIVRRSEGDDAPALADLYEDIGHALGLGHFKTEAVTWALRGISLREFHVKDEERRSCLAIPFQKLGAAYMENKQYCRALQYLNRSLHLLRKEPSRSVQQQRRLASLLMDLGRAYRENSEYDRAIQHFNMSLGLLESMGDMTVLARDGAKSLHELAQVYEQQYDMERACSLHRQGLSWREQQLGTSNSSTLESMDCLGRALVAAGQAHDGLSLHERAMQMRTERNGHGDTLEAAESHDSLGEAHGALGSLDKSVRHHEKAMEIREKLLRKDHPVVAAAAHKLGVALERRGNSDEAIRTHKHALSLRKQIRRRHPDTAESLDSLGMALYRAGAFLRARSLLQSGLNTRRQVLGEHHVKTGESFFHVGLSHRALGNSKSAISAFAKCLKIRCGALGEGHPLTQEVHEELATAHAQASDYLSALGHHERRYLGCTTAKGQNLSDCDPIGVEMQKLRARILSRARKPKPASISPCSGVSQSMGEVQEYEGLLDHFARGSERSWSLCDAVDAFIQLSRLYCSHGAYMTAASRLEEGIAYLKKTGGDHNSFQRLHWELSRVYMQAGQVESAVLALDEALDVEKDCKEQRERYYGALAEVYVRDKNGEKALEALRELCQMRCPDKVPDSVGHNERTLAKAVGLALLETGDYSNAILALSVGLLPCQSQADDPWQGQDAAIHRGLGEAYYKRNISLNSHLGVANNAFTLREDGKEAKKHLLASIEAHETQNSRPTGESASIHSLLGVAYLGYGETRSSIRALRTALSEHRAVQPEANTNTAFYLGLLGNAYCTAGQSSPALNLHQERMAILQQTLGAEHADTLACHHDMGASAYHEGLYNEAERHLQTCLQRWDCQRDTKTIDLSRTYDLLGSIYEDQYRFKEARAMKEMALRIAVARCGEDHPATAEWLHSLAVVSEKEGHYDVAGRLHSKALNLRLKHLGRTHPDTATSHWYRAEMYRKYGDLDKAYTQGRQLLNVRVHCFDKDSAEVALANEAMGHIQLDRSEYDKAVHLCQRALSILEKRKDPLLIAQAMDSLGIALLGRAQNSDIAHALDLHERALKRRVGLLGPGSPGIANSYLRIGNAQRVLKKHDDSLDSLRHSEAILSSICGQTHLNTHLERVKDSLGCTLRAKGDFGAAIDMHQGILKRRQDILNPGHPMIAESYHYLGEDYEAAGDMLKATKMYDASLSVRRMGPYSASNRRYERLVAAKKKKLVFQTIVDDSIEARLAQEARAAR